MGKQILITGGAGFIGSYLADQLLREGHAVRILDNLSSQSHGKRIPEEIAHEIEFVLGDLLDPVFLHRALNDVDVIFHFAAAVGVGQSMYEINRYVNNNTQGTAELLQGLIDVKQAPEKIILASSMAVYGEGRYVCSKCSRDVLASPRSLQQLKAGEWESSCIYCGGVLKPRPTNEDKTPEPGSVYALSKRNQEELCLLYGQTYGTAVTALRLFNVYGPRQTSTNPYTGTAGVFVSRLMSGQAPLIFEDGQQTRDYVSVHDVVRANMLAMESSEANGQVINIGSGIPISTLRVAEIMATSVGKAIEPVITRNYRAGDIRHCYADISKARTLLNYEPEVAHETGLQELAEWLAQQESGDRTETKLSELSAYGLTA